MNKLQLLLTKKGLEPLEKGFIYAILLSQLSQKQTLTEEETADLISGSIFLAENKSLNLDPVLLKQAKEAVTVQASRMKEYLERGKPNETLLDDNKGLKTQSISGITMENGHYPRRISLFLYL